MYDVAVIGAGPAGLTAAMYSARYGLKTIFFETSDPISQLSLAAKIENYPGFEGVGMELLEKMKEQALKAGAEGKLEKVIKIIKLNKVFKVITESGEYIAKAVIVATGGKYKEAGIDGEKIFIGRGVSYCATCDGAFFKGRKVVVFGSGRRAVHEALHLHDIGCKVSIISASPQLKVEKFLIDRIEKRKIEVLTDTVIKKIIGSNKVEKIVIFNKKDKKEIELEVDGVFIAVGMIPATDIVAELGVERDAGGYIKVDKEQKTNVDGVFAAGDCCSKPLKQVLTACGDGVLAAYSAYKYLMALEVEF
ncbi:MAG: thioredoxin-disulfide reductase [Archaeoglobaceae archaeon]|nr:thioredoxin-disulfide reductase [Archaeoglobaceae archaeon]MCX8151488.1 thioredoxin-disulfide reductase [Archaeoglobaceae archaeon]MDW8014250.1 thioredoxin-disulfide reductase [Archaeoglobaceae archaeon]